MIPRHLFNFYQIIFNSHSKQLISQNKTEEEYGKCNERKLYGEKMRNNKNNSVNMP
jgi:hypothetical protein